VSCAYFGHELCDTNRIADFPNIGISWMFVFSALTLLVRRKEWHPACIKTELWGAGAVVCFEQGADLHMIQLMPLPLTVFCFTKSQIGFTFLVPAHPGSPGQRAIKWVFVYVAYVTGS